jgi:tRNA (cmo5U34)-methyltransferase
MVIRAACPGLNKSNNIPHRLEGKEVLFDHIPNEAIRALGLGTGDGRLLINKRPDIHAVAMDIPPLMLERGKSRFADEPNIQIIEHDLNNPLPNMEYYNAVISGFAVHHLSHERKHSLCQENV